MAEATKSQEPSTSTVVVESESTASEPPVVKLKLKKPKSDKGVKWDEEVVDNEFMNKKKSKCCCIYEKPRMFGESSSEEDSDDDCNHCRKHKSKDFRQPNPEGAAGGADPAGAGAGAGAGADS